MAPSAYSVALVSVPDRKTAERISMALLRGRLAACVSQVPGVDSLYWWEGRIESSRERLLVVKTRGSLLPRLIRCVREHHPYRVPEILSWPIRDGNPDYLRWIAASTGSAAPFPT